MSGRGGKEARQHQVVPEVSRAEKVMTNVQAKRRGRHLCSSVAYILSGLVSEPSIVRVNLRMIRTRNGPAAVNR